MWPPRVLIPLGLDVVCSPCVRALAGGGGLPVSVCFRCTQPHAPILASWLHFLFKACGSGKEIWTVLLTVWRWHAEQKEATKAWCSRGKNGCVRVMETQALFGDTQKGALKYRMVDQRVKGLIQPKLCVGAKEEAVWKGKRHFCFWKRRSKRLKWQAGGGATCNGEEGAAD